MNKVLVEEKVYEDGSKVPVFMVYSEEGKEGCELIKTTATIKDKDGNVTEYRQSVHAVDFGGNCQKAVEKFGEKSCYDAIVGKGTIDFQNAVRRCMETDREEELQGMSTNWTFGYKLGRSAETPEQTVSRLSQATPDQQDAVMRGILKARGLSDADIERLMKKAAVA